MTIELQSDPEGVEEDRSVASLPTATDIDEVAARIRCLNDHVLVKLEESPKMIGLIHIPDTAINRDECWARVVKVGPGARIANGERDTPEFRPGDRVLLGRDPGWELAGGYRMLRIGAVMAVERNES